jgi:tripartite-type tricarboxylate transporter receptor subunit TctC
MAQLPSRFRSLRRLFLAGLFSLAAGFAQAQASPPIRLLVGFPPGGSTDVLARALAQEARRTLGQDVLVVNKPGATGWRRS